MRLAQGGGRDFTQSDRLDLARAHQVRKRAHAVFDGHLLVPAVQVVEIDHVGAQALQRGFAGGTQRGRAAVDHTHQLAVASHVHPLHAAFAGEGELRAVL